MNKWTFSTALFLHRLGWPTEKISAFLHTHTTRSGQEGDNEIERAVQNAPGWLKGQTATSVSRWPSINNALTEKITGGGFRHDDLRSASPIKCTRTDEVLPVLFPSDPFVWAADSVSPERGSGTFRLGQLLPFASSKQFIVPNPMISCLRPGAGKSSRCKANVAARQFLVIERDHGTLDEQAAILWHLADFAPLVLVVYSAGKSLHGWFYVASRTEAQCREFMNYAVSLGSDRATWVKCQPVRMPGGFRPGKGIQEIVFFDRARTEEGL